MNRRERFEAIYARHAPAVKAYVLRRSDAAGADDAVAEVFVVCWRRFDDVPPDPLPWLLAVARRVLSTQRRSARRRAALGERLEHAAQPVPQTGDGALAEALARQSDSDRELLLLIAWDGLTPAQAAVALGVKPSTVRVRLMRARRRLSAALVNERTTAATPMEVQS